MNTEENPSQNQNISDEIKDLSNNLINIFRSAWDHPERKNLTKEIESGISEMGSILRSEVEKFESSPAGQELKSDVDDLQQRIKSGEFEEKIRMNLISVLQTANNELKRLNEQLHSVEDLPGQNVEDTEIKTPQE